MVRAPLQGFHDYPPPDGGARSEIRRRMRAAARRAGFVELEVPCVENFELYETKSGEEIAKETWRFEDKGGRPVALIPEQTPSLARVFVARAKSEPLPVKWFTVSKSWRYEEPQAGRTREFLQFNLDILGVPGVEAEAELLATAALLLDEVGAEGLYTLRLNDRALAEGIGRLFGAGDAATFFRAVDRFRKVAAPEFVRELERAGVGPERSGALAAILGEARTGIAPPELDAFLSTHFGGIDDAGRAGADRLRRLFALVSSLGLADRVVYDPTVVRGLAYYTSTVFEAFAKSGKGRSVFGGGRYDHLIELFDGPPTPAAGLAVGDQTLELLLRDAGRWPDGEPPLDTYVVVADPSHTPEALRLVGELRRVGRSAETDLLGRSMSRQFKEAARRRSRRALILGLREATPGALVERDLSTGAQREIARDAAARPA
jgi:histidyl-tRNA synthetase